MSNAFPRSRGASPIVDALESRRLLSIAYDNGLLTLTGTAKNDHLNVSTPKAHKGYVRADDGHVHKDVKIAYVKTIAITAARGNDVITVSVPKMPTKPNVSVHGDGGNDTITTDGGNDTIYGGSGDDSIVSGAGDDCLSGDDGADTITSGDGHDTLLGVDEDDATDASASDTLVAVAVASGDASTLHVAASFAAAGPADQMVYASKDHLLFLVSGGPFRTQAAIRVVDSTTGKQIGSTLLPKGRFTDVDLSPSGDYLYAADFGYENPAPGIAEKPSYVWRYQLSTHTWSAASQITGYGYKIEAVDDDRFVTLSSDGQTTLELHRFGATRSTLLASAAGDYEGDIEYAPATHTIYQGVTGTTSSRVHAYTLDVDRATFADAGLIGVRDTDGIGGATTLSTDGATLYYGERQIDLRNPANDRRSFTSNVVAAGTDVAVGLFISYNYSTHASSGTVTLYDAASGATLFNRSGTSAAFAADGRSFFVYDEGSSQLVRYDE